MLPWILIGEVFPAEIRNSASGFAGGVGYIFGFLANKLFLLMLSALTLPGTFAFYASVAFFGTVVLYFTLPETEGRTLGVSIHYFFIFYLSYLTIYFRKSKLISPRNPM